MTKLENLLMQKEVINQMKKSNEKEINEQQIVREGYVINQLKFKKIKEDGNVIFYEREMLTNAKYVLILNLGNPNLVCLQRVGQDITHGFDINSIEEFLDLLIFLNIF